MNYTVIYNCSSNSTCQLDGDSVRCQDVEPGNQCSVSVRPVVCGSIVGQESGTFTCNIKGKYLHVTVVHVYTMSV